jgi:hypothetical protein
VRRFGSVLLFGLLAACSKGDSSAPPEKTTEAARKLAGVYPESFQCDSVTSVAALGQVLGGKVSPLDSAMSTPRGVPHPCNYVVQAETTEYWTYDIDCRDGMKQRADALFAQYRDDSSAMLHQYNTLADAGAIKPTDAGIAIHAPDPATEVAVGAKGLDHHGQGLIFIDDDAPCYVRVVGPDSARRLELAKLVAKNLTFVNAPMTPRPMP